MKSAFSGMEKSHLFARRKNSRIRWIFDCDVEKQGPVIHCGCTTGGGRLVIFIRKDGSEARLLLDTSDVYSSYMPRFQKGPYYYSFTKRIDGTFLDAFLAEEEWQSVYLYDSEYE